MKKIIIIILCVLLLVLAVCLPKYRKISFDSENIGIYVSKSTIVENTVSTDLPTKMPIYKISKRKISYHDYTQTLNALGLPAYPEISERSENKMYYSLVDYTDDSRGYFEMTEEEAINLAWEYFEKIPYIKGEYECVGIRDTYTLSDSSGDHILRAGVTFCRVLDGTRVLGGDKCTLYFDGSGLVGFSISLYKYTKIGSMDLVPLDQASEKINTPDSFSIKKSDSMAQFGVSEKLDVENIAIRLVNQHSNGCTILQPVYCFFGTATDSNENEAEFTSIVIAIPDSYTYEGKPKY